MPELTDYLNPDDYPALQTLPFAVFITGKEHAVNAALDDYIYDLGKHHQVFPCTVAGDIGYDWHYSEYEAELRQIESPFYMIVQSYELIQTAFRVFGERMALIRVDSGYELVIYNHVSLNAALSNEYEVR